jgi:hypothetical protein
MSFATKDDIWRGVRLLNSDQLWNYLMAIYDAAYKDGVEDRKKNTEVVIPRSELGEVSP